MTPYYIFTGGPGSGKSSVLEAMALLGHCVVPEVGRQIIKQQIQQQGEALPWKDKQLYFELMFEQSLLDYHKQPQDVLTFFDRGILDSIGYAYLEDLQLQPNHLTVAKTASYAPIVFIFPPWEAIYQKDAERKQDIETAKQTYLTLGKTYVDFGYTLIEIPCTTIEKRAEFILNSLHLPL